MTLLSGNRDAQQIGNFVIVQSASSESCPCCGKSTLQTFLEISNMPVLQNILVSSEELSVNCRRAKMQLAYCLTCSFITNTIFDSKLVEYSESYENTQCHSPVFRNYMNEIIQYLISSYSLDSKTILEIGCGKGHFLKALIEKVDNGQGIGYDPSFIKDENVAHPRLTFITDFYNSESRPDRHPNLICCRHVLEHIPSPLNFLTDVRNSLNSKEDVILFFEIPDAEWILDNLAFWDFFYEHCNYFSKDSVKSLFNRAGFDVLKMTKSFGGQYLWVEAKLKANCEEQPIDFPSVSIIERQIENFLNNFPSKLDVLKQDILASLKADNIPVFWGAGAKGIAILNALDLGTEIVPFVIDVNPRKQGGFITGTRQQIVSPSQLKSLSSTHVYVMNPNYLDEVATMLREQEVQAVISAL